MPSVNYAELAANAPSFEPLPKNTYEGEVTSAEFRVASSGNPMYRLEFTVDSGPHKGRKFWTNVVLNADNPNSVGFFFGRMRSAFGLGPEFWASLPAENQEAQVCAALSGKKVTAKLSIRTWNGKQSNEVDDLRQRAPGVGEAAPAAAAGGDPLPAAAPPQAPGLPPGL